MGSQGYRRTVAKPMLSAQMEVCAFPIVVATTHAIVAGVKQSPFLPGAEHLGMYQVHGSVIST